MGGQNPYEAPQADVNVGAGVDRAALPPIYNQAGLGTRLLNMLIDNVLVVVLGSVVVAVSMLLSRGEATSEVASNVIAFGVMIGYYVVLEAAFGWTIGKLITGTRVKRADGGKPKLGQIIGRTAARFIPFEPFSLLFGNANVGWHDSLSGTLVVRVRR